MARAQKKRLAEKAHSPRTGSGDLESVHSGMSSGDSWRDDMRLTPRDRSPEGDAISTVVEGNAGEEGSAGEPFIADGSALGAEVPEGSGSDAPFVPDGSGLAPEIP